MAGAGPPHTVKRSEITMQATDQPEPADTPTPGTWVCTGPGDHTETVVDANGVTHQTWHGCPSCHGSH
jgi:hypothetical protein